MPLIRLSVFPITIQANVASKDNHHNDLIGNNLILLLNYHQYYTEVEDFLNGESNPVI